MVFPEQNVSRGNMNYATRFGNLAWLFPFLLTGGVKDIASVLTLPWPPPKPLSSSFLLLTTLLWLWFIPKYLLFEASKVPSSPRRLILSTMEQWSRASLALFLARAASRTVRSTLVLARARDLETDAAAILQAQRRMMARRLSNGAVESGKKEKVCWEQGGQRKGEGGGEGRQERWVREEHLVHETKRWAKAEEVTERGWSKKSKQEGQKEEGWRRRTQDVHRWRFMPRIQSRWRRRRSFELQLPHSPFRGKLVVGGGFMAIERDLGFWRVKKDQNNRETDPFLICFDDRLFYLLLPQS